MDDKILIKEMLKDFIKRRPTNKYGYREGCPFIGEKGDQYHDLCAILFPGWGKKHLKNKKWSRTGCPCTVMSKPYVKRKARAFVKRR